MSQILLLSDTHGMTHAGAWPYMEAADEVWHAGDLGPLALLEEMRRRTKAFRAVYGNADPEETRRELPEHTHFKIEGMGVLMLHIAGRPGRYQPGAAALLRRYRPHLFVCGHSHITLVQQAGPEFAGTLHLNPGAAGHHGFHKMCTMLRMRLGGGKIQQLEVVELGLRGQRLASNE